MSEGPVREPEPAAPASSTGLESNLAGPLCYLLGFVTGVAFLVLERKDRLVRFHAYQSVATFGVLFVLLTVLGFLGPVGRFLDSVIGLVALAIWVLLMVKAFQGERYKLPVVGDWADQQVASL